MEHYYRAETREEPLELSRVPIASVPDDIVWMKVKPASRVGNMVGFAKSQLKFRDHILWSGSGQAVCKTLMSAELLKKSLKDLHQETSCCYHRVTEVWKPKENAGLDALEVHKDIPIIHILLSKSAVNADSASYQAPQHGMPFWQVDRADGNSTTTQTRKNTIAHIQRPGGHSQDEGNAFKRPKKPPRQQKSSAAKKSKAMASNGAHGSSKRSSQEPAGAASSS